MYICTLYTFAKCLKTNRERGDVMTWERDVGIDRELDELCRGWLIQAGLSFPPVDTFQLARRLGFEVVFDTAHTQRASCVRLARRANPRGLIILRPDRRAERLHWAVAHELGEHLLPAVMARCRIPFSEFEPGRREWLANELAKRLLVPLYEFETSARQCGWDLVALKERFSTASYEVLARRMLDGKEPMVITIFDQGRLTLRKGNFPGCIPPLSRNEEMIWHRTHGDGEHRCEQTPNELLQVWAIHEPGWKREILRTQGGWMGM